MYLDSVLFTSGPVFTDLVFGCKEDEECNLAPNPASEIGCFGEEQECLIDWTYGSTATICKPPDSQSIGGCQADDGDAPNWEVRAAEDALVPSDESLHSPDYDYPFAVHFLYGRDDNGEAPPQAMKYRGRLADLSTTETSCESILAPGLVGPAHGVPWGDSGFDPEGAGPDAVLNRLQTYCLPRVDQPDVTVNHDEDDGCTLNHPPVP